MSIRFMDQIAEDLKRKIKPKLQSNCISGSMIDNAMIEATIQIDNLITELRKYCNVDSKYLNEIYNMAQKQHRPVSEVLEEKINQYSKQKNGFIWKGEDNGILQ